MQATTQSKTIRTVTRALRILRAVNGEHSLNVSEISIEAELPYATTYRILKTLANEGIVKKIDKGTSYQPTALALSLSCGYGYPLQLVNSARDHIVELTRQTNWPISISARIGSRMVIQDSTHALTTKTFSEYMPGYSLPILSSASGLAYLSALPNDQRSRLMGQISEEVDLAPATRMVRRNSTYYFNRINELGYASCIRNQHTKDPGKTSSIAVPIVYDGYVYGTLILIFFSKAVSVAEAYERYGKYIHKAQTEIQSRLGHCQTKSGIVRALSVESEP